MRSLAAALAVLICSVVTANAQAQKQAPSWTYGEHPLWGVSAHVTVGDQSVGLRCLPPQRGEAPLPVVGAMYTPGLVQPDGEFVNYKFVGSRGEGSYKVERKGKYFEGTGTTCGISFTDFQKARTLTLNDGNDKPKILARIPLSGAKAAIDKLIAACPAIKKDMADCGD